MELTIFEQHGFLYADSREVAETVGKRHDHLLRDIDRYIKALKGGKSTDPNFGVSKIDVKDFFVPATYTDSTGRELPYYLITRKGCDLIAHKLTGDKGIRFSAVYINRFYEMEQELTRREIARSERKPIRRNLTDALRDSGEDERMHGHAYSTYTDAIYKAVLGKSAKELRQERAGGQKVNASTLLAAEELEAVAAMENRVCVLLDFGLIYNQIKGMLSKGTQRVLTGTRSA